LGVLSELSSAYASVWNPTENGPVQSEKFEQKFLKIWAKISKNLHFQSNLNIFVLEKGHISSFQHNYGITILWKNTIVE
jgi:hypothetical protein